MELEKLFPIYKVEHDLILSFQGDVTAAFEVELPEVFSLNSSGFEALHFAWNKAIGVLQAHTVFHKQDWFLNRTYTPKYQEREHTFHSLSSERFFAERMHLEHRCRLFLTQRPKGNNLGNSAMSNLLRKTMVPSELLGPKVIEEFERTLGQFSQILRDAGLGIIRKKGDELTGTQSCMGLFEEYLGLGINGRLQDIAFDPEWKIGNQYVQLFSIAEVDNLPHTVSPFSVYEPYGTDQTEFPIGFASPISSLLPCNHIYNQFLFIEDAHQKLKDLETKRLRLESLSNYSRNNALARDAVSGFLNEAISQGKKPVKAHFNVMLWSDSKEEFRSLGNLTAGALAKMNVLAKQETVGAPQIFWAGLPGNQAAFPVNDTFDTFLEPATCFFNLESQYKSSVSPIGIRLGDRLTGYPVQVDISDEPMKLGLITNRNKFVLGPSGSGKSFLTNHLMRSYYQQGSHIVLVDVGHSYRGLCELVNGFYFTYEENDPIRFNPFYVQGRRRPDTEKKESLKTLLYALWKKEDELFRRSEYVALSNALSGYFELLENDSAVFPCFDTFYEYLKSQFREQLKQDKVRGTDFDLENFLYVLRPYYRGGEFDYLLNARDNLDLLGQRLIVFELDNIKDHPILFPVVTLMIMEIFISKMRKLKGVRKIILIEEAWKAIAKQGMAEYIKYLFKTVRKFFGEAIVVTQEVEDIISSPVVKNAILNNADVKILMDQSKFQNKFREIQELLGLTDQEKAVILSMNKAKEPGRNYKEVYISIYKKVYRVEVSQQEYLTYTTEESERIKVDEYCKKYGSRQNAIQMICEENLNQK